MFWDVHDPEKTAVIRLRDERYARLAIEVDDPRATAAAIQGRDGWNRERKGTNYGSDGRRR